MENAPTIAKFSFGCAALSGGVVGCVMGLLVAGQGVNGLWIGIALILLVPVYAVSNHGWMSTQSGAVGWYLKRIVLAFIGPAILSGSFAFALG